jgi:hypothetical protein
MKIMKKILFAITGLLLLLPSCEFLEQNTPEGLSDSEIIEGLKTALIVGADSSSLALSALNGYYGNPLLKIPLPSEAELVRSKINNNTSLALISNTIGLDDLFEDVILSVNRSAEDAAREAAPIFKDAITNLTIDEGWDILHGVVPSETVSLKAGDFDSTAATNFLSQKTYVPLTDLYAPKINASLSKDLVGNVSAVDVWTALTTTYNNFLNRSDVKFAISAATILGQNPNLPAAINSDLGEFSTQKALDGLFLRVGDEEIKIRRDPWQWVTTVVGDILTKVFGSIE